MNRLIPPRAAIAGGLLAAVTLALHLAAQPAPRQAPDFMAARAEVTRLLQDLIRIDTSNPPGNETKAAEYIKRVLDRDGIASEIFELEPGRGNLVARLKGSGRKRPILLMAHTDVVGIEREKWTFDPFSGVAKDGYVYGRGAEDDKDTVAAGLMALLLINRQKIPLDRDIIFLAEAGEEGTPHVGVDFMVQKHWDRIDAEFALAEGGRTAMVGGDVKYVGIATTEKVPRGLRLVARGTSGHGSVPRPDNAIVHLAAAVAKIGAWRPPMRLNDTTRTFFSRLAPISPAGPAAVFRGLLSPDRNASAQESLQRDYIAYDSMVRTSVVPTIIKGGFRSNVIPGDAEVTLDVRALPDENMDQLVSTLADLIDDPAVEIIRTPVNRPAPQPSRLDTELFSALERAQAAMYPHAVTLPMMLTGATDNAQLRAKGVQAYGLGTPTDDGDSGAHGNDERTPIDGVRQFVELIYRAVVDVAAAPAGTR